MEFRILGPVELWIDGRQYSLGTAQQRCVLAVLLYAAGKPVSYDTLVDCLWKGEPPPSAPNGLRSHISKIRGLLRDTRAERGRLSRLDRSYQLQIDDDSVDLLRFRRLNRQARAIAEAGDTERAISLFHEAEALWRGEPFAEFAGAGAVRIAARLHEEYRAVREARIGFELERGRHAHLIGELREMADRYPDAHRTCEQLMYALSRSGRYDEASAAYQNFVRRSWAKTGLEPEPALARLHQQILDRDPALRAPEVARPEPRTPTRPPDTLIRDIADFTGRRFEIRMLLAEDTQSRTAMPVTVIHGMAGVGKTRLAVHAGHLLRERYADGRYYVDLRAHSQLPPRDPADALASLLTQNGVHDQDLPRELDEMAARWRWLMAGKCALLILDDAKDAEQVRPLLPGAATCRVLVTSRHRLADLEGARSLPLDIPASDEAVALFDRIVSDARLSDRNAVRRVVERCGRHPLAIRVVANHLCRRRVWKVSELDERLAQAVIPSDGLTDECDSPPDVVRAFELSYAGLGDRQQWVFRYLALHPGPDLTDDAAAVLVGMDAAVVRRSLEELADRHILEESIGDRYCFHDLMRRYALWRGQRVDSPVERHSAIRRLLDYFLAAADRADRLVHPHRRRLDVEPDRVPASMPPLDNEDDGRIWLDLERSNLLALAQMAASKSREHAGPFAHVLADALRRWGAWKLAAELSGTALDAWRERGDTRAEAQCLVECSAVLWNQGAHQEALRCATQALTLSKDLEDPAGQAEALFWIGSVRLISGRRGEALAYLGESLELHRRAGSRRGEGDALNLHGVALGMAGNRHQAEKLFRAALVIHQQIDNRNGALKALNNIGETFHAQKRYDEARDYFERALAIVKEVGGRQELANLYNNLGNVYRDTGEQDRALSYFFKALDSYRASADLRCEADCLVNIGTTYEQLAQRAKALAHFTAANRIASQISNHHEQERALLAIAGIHRSTGRYGEAEATYREVLGLSPDSGEATINQAHALAGLAHCLRDTRGVGAARSAWQEALAIYEALDAPEAEAVCGLLGGSGDAG